MPEAPAATAAPAATPAPAVVVTPPARRFELPVEIAPQPAKPPAETVAEGVAPAADAQKPPADQAPATEPEVKPEEVTPEQAAKREGRRFERRLDKAYRQRAEAQARADLFEKQLVEARAATPQAKPAEGEPKLADFDYDPEKYATAKAEYATKQAEKNLSEKQRTAAHQAERQKLVSGWEEKVEAALDKYEDWSDVVGEIQPDSPFTAAIMEADNGPDIAHYLGKHPSEAKRIAQLPPRSQVREIGKLEAKLAATPEKPKAPSKAPAPITPLSGAAPVASQEPSEQDDMKSWLRKRNKQVYGRT